MSLSHEHIGPKIFSKLKIHILNREELLFPLCYEIPCSIKITNQNVATLCLEHWKKWHYFFSFIQHSLLCKMFLFFVTFLMIEAFRSLSRLFASDAFHQKLIHNPRKRINQKSATREREVKKKGKTRKGRDSY